MADRKITYGVGFNVDKSGLNSIKSAFNEISKIANTATADDFLKFNPNKNLAQAQKELLEIKSTASSVETALQKAFNQKLGTINMEVFNRELKSAGLNINKVYTEFSKLGTTGQNAFLGLAASTTSVNLQLKETTGILDRMATTLANTIKWNLASSAINTMTGSVQQAFGFVKNLDSSLNDIRIVTGKSADQMKVFAETANTAAKSLGQSTRAYTDASLIYYQQGLGDREAQARADVTLKAANVTGQNAQEVSEQLTAIWNGYKVTAQEAELYIDKVAAVAAGTAADLEELATGMSKVASAANAMGIDVDQLNAQLATIVSVTRQAPESIGTALKTIYARMSDLKLGGTDEDGMNLGKVSGQLADIGINILDETGNLRDMGDVIEEVAGKWDTWTNAQQVAVAQVMAGTRQYNNLVALFENWDMYTDALNMSAQAAGTLNQQQAIYMESTAAHLQQLATASEDLYKSLLDPETVNTVTDAFRGLIELTTSWVDSLGGGLGVLKNMAAVAPMIFSKQIAKSITNTYQERERGKQNQRKIGATLNTIESYRNDLGEKTPKQVETLLSNREKLLNLSQYMDPKTFNQMNSMIDAMVPDMAELARLESFQKTYKEIINAIKDSAGINLLKGLDEKDKIQLIENKLKEVIKTYNDLQEETREGFNTDNINNLKNTITQLANFKLINQTDSDKLTADLTRYDDLLKAKEQLSEWGFLDEDTTISQDLEELERIINLRIQRIGKDLGGISEDVMTEISAILNDTSKTTEQKIKEFSDKLKGATEEFNEGLKAPNMEILLSHISETVGGITTLTSAASNLTEVWRIMGDEDLEGFEKFKQVSLNLLTTIPMLISGFISLRSGIIGWATDIGIATAGTNAFGAAIQGLWTKFLASSLAPIAAIAIAIGGVAMAYDFLTTSAKEAAAAEAKSREEFRKQDEELKTLESKLADVNSQLEQLYGIAEEDLTITNIEDIARLESENELIRNQIELLKESRAEAARTAVTDANLSYKKGNYDIKAAEDYFSNSNRNIITGHEGNNEIFNPTDVDTRTIIEQLKQYDNVKQYGEDFLDFSIEQESKTSQAEYETFINNAGSYLLEKRERDKASLDELEAGLRQELDRLTNERDGRIVRTQAEIAALQKGIKREPSVNDKQLFWGNLVNPATTMLNLSRQTTKEGNNALIQKITDELDQAYLTDSDINAFVSAIQEGSPSDIIYDIIESIDNGEESALTKGYSKLLRIDDTILDIDDIGEHNRGILNQIAPLTEDIRDYEARAAEIRTQLGFIDSIQSSLFEETGTFSADAINDFVEHEKKGVTEYFETRSQAIAEAQQAALETLQHYYTLEDQGKLTDLDREEMKKWQTMVKQGYEETGRLGAISAKAFKYSLNEKEYQDIMALEDSTDFYSMSDDELKQLVGGAEDYKKLEIQARAYGLTVRDLFTALRQYNGEFESFEQALKQDGDLKYEAIESASERMYRQSQAGAEIMSKALKSFKEDGTLDLDEDEMSTFTQTLSEMEGIFDSSISALEEWNNLQYAPPSERLEYIQKLNDALFKNIAKTKEDIQIQAKADLQQALISRGQARDKSRKAKKAFEQYQIENPNDNTSSTYVQLKEDYENAEKRRLQQEAEVRNIQKLQQSLENVDPQRIQHIFDNVSSIGELKSLFDGGIISLDEYIVAYDTILEKQRESLGYSKAMIDTLVEQKIAATNLSKEDATAAVMQELQYMAGGKQLAGLDLPVKINPEMDQAQFFQEYSSLISATESAFTIGLDLDLTDEKDKEKFDKLAKKFQDPAWYNGLIKASEKGATAVSDYLVETLELTEDEAAGIANSYTRGMDQTLKTLEAQIFDGDTSKTTIDAYKEAASAYLGVSDDLFGFYDSDGTKTIQTGRAFQSAKAFQDFENLISGYDFKTANISEVNRDLISSGAKDLIAGMIGVNPEDLAQAAVDMLGNADWLSLMQKALRDGDLDAFEKAYEAVASAHLGKDVDIDLNDLPFKIITDQVIKESERFEAAQKAFEEGTATKEQIELLAAQATSTEELNKLKARYVEVGGEATNLDKIAAANKDKLVDSTLEQIGANRELLNLYMQQFGLTEEQALIKLGFDVNQDDFKSSVSSAYESIKDTDFGEIETSIKTRKISDNMSVFESVDYGYDSDQLLAVYNLMESLEQITGKEFAEGSLLDGETMKLFQEGMKGSAESMQLFIEKIIALLDLAGSPEAEILKQLLTGLSTEGQATTMDQTVADAGDQLSALKSMQDMKKDTNEWNQAVDDLYETFEDLAGAEDIIKNLENGTIDLGTATDDLVDLVLKEVESIKDLSDEQWDLYKSFLRTNDVVVDGYANLEDYIDAVELARDREDELDFEGVAKSMGEGASQLDTEIEMWKKGFSDRETLELAFGIEIDDEVYGYLQNIFNDLLARYQGYVQEMEQAGLKPISMQSYLNLAIDSNAREEAAAAGAEARAAVDSLNGVHLEADMTATLNLNFETILSGITSLGGAIGGLLKRVIEAAFGNATITSGETTGTIRNPGGGGGGGGGEEEPSDPQRKDPLDERPDVYHDINIEIEKLTRSFENLADAQEKLMGKKLLNNLNAQLKVIEKQKTALEEKRAIAEDEAERLRNELLQIKVGKKELTLEFDESTGQVTNYEEILRKQIAVVNKRIAEYNSKQTGEEQEPLEEGIEEEEKKLEKLKELLEEYETTINETIPDIDDELTELFNQEIELKIQKFKLSVDVKLEWGEIEREWNDFVRRVIKNLDDEDILGNAEMQLENLQSYFNNNSGISEISSLMNQVNALVFELNMLKETGFSSVYGDNETALMEDLEEYVSKLQDSLIDIKDIQKEIQEAYYETIDNVKEDFDKQIENYEHVSDLLNHDIEVIKMLYGEDEYTALNSFYNSLHTNNLNALDSLAQQAAFWKEQMTNAVVGSEEWKKFKENYEEAISATNELVEESLDVILNKYNSVINQIFDNLNKSFLTDKEGKSLGLGLDYIKQEWDLVNRNADMYLDTINEAYAIQNLERKYQKAIDETSSVKNQKKLNDLMEERLKYLEEQGKLTQYDIEREEKLFNLELKRIALEEAQENKSKMRLRRDAQGNYSYQYIADEDAIAKAQEELAAAQNDLYNFDLENYKENLNQAHSLYEEYQQEIIALYQDQTLSAEERDAKIALITTQYQEMITGLIRENTDIRNNLQSSAMENFKAFVDDEKDLIMSDLIPAWDSALQTMINTLNEKGVNGVFSEVYEQLDQALIDYNNGVGQIFTNSQQNLGELENGIDQVVTNTQSWIEANNTLIDSATAEIEAMQGIITVLNQLTESYKETAEAANAAAQAGHSALQANNQQSSTETTAVSPFYNNVQETDNQNEQDANKLLSKEVYISLSEANENGIKTWQVRSMKDYELMAYGTVDQNATTISEEDITAAASGVSLARIQSWWEHAQKFTSRFATGGYTGEWGSDGRLAILDQKELVLNQKDTANILKTVDLVRKITDSLNSNMEAKLIGMMNNIATARNIISQYQREVAAFDQQVHIDANFPNVTNSAEIESAFNNLVNIAAQRAMENRR